MQGNTHMYLSWLWIPLDSHRIVSVFFVHLRDLSFSESDSPQPCANGRGSDKRALISGGPCRFCMGLSEYPSVPIHHLHIYIFTYHDLDQ